MKFIFVITAYALFAPIYMMTSVPFRIGTYKSSANA